MKNELYGSLKNFSNIGEAGIRTGGKYREDKPSGINHAERINNAHAFKSLYGVSVPNLEKQTISLDLEAVKYFMKQKKYSKTQLRLKAMLTTVTFGKAIKGENIYMMTANKIADVLDADVEDILR